MVIGCGIPLRIVRAVEDSSQLVRMLAHYGIETGAILRRLDFSRVSFTDGRYGVGENDAALEQIEIAVKLDARSAEVMPGQIGKGEVQTPKRTLIRQVMNRQDRSKRQPPLLDQGG